MQVKLTVLCENSVGRPVAAVGEHGFACLIETAGGSYLFDTGQGLGLMRNARALRKDLAALRGVLLSHGHYDHTGGLPELLRLTSPLEVFAHPEIFAERYWVGADSTRFIGLPFRRPYLEGLGARFRLSRDYCRVAPGLYLSGEVPRRTSFERGDPHMMAALGDDGALVPDPFRDDQSLVLETDKGLVVVLGCAHAGLINILSHLLERTGRDRFYAVLGGTHLGMSSDQQFAATLQALETFPVERIGVSHCTGLPRAAALQQHFGARFFFASVGTVLEA